MGRTASKIQMATHILPKNRRKGKKRRRRQYSPKENELEPCPADAPASPKKRGAAKGWAQSCSTQATTSLLF